MHNVTINGKEYEQENGIITKTMLGFEDHGIFSFYLWLDLEGCGQGFGGWQLDKWDMDDTRLGTQFGTECIFNILKVVGVKNWEDLKGKHVRVRRSKESRLLYSIGNIIKDEWLSPKELFDEISKFEEV